MRLCRRPSGPLSAPAQPQDVPPEISGTPGYMSPEQARGECLDARADIFSFGVVLYEMATGHRPFEGRNRSESLHATLTVEPPPLSHFREDVPLELESIVRKALEKDR